MKISSSAPLEETSEAIDLLLLRLISFCGGPEAHIILALCLGSQRLVACLYAVMRRHSSDTEQWRAR